MPTVLFILAAYGIYALIGMWCRRHHQRFIGRLPPKRPRWVTLSVGAGILGLTLWLVFWLAPLSPGQKVRLAGVLGVTEGEAWLAKQAAPRDTLPPVKQPAPGDQPAYALLHPESPPTLSPPAKPPTGAQLRKPKGTRPPALESKKFKDEPKLTKKEKSSSKVKAKKKKSSRAPAKPPRNSQEGTG